MDRRSFLTTLTLAPVAAIAADSFLLFDSFGTSPAGGSRHSASMWTYLWDLVDEGYDQVLKNLSSNGLTSISLATAYHAGRFLAPHNPKHKVVFPEDGTVYFQPNPKVYGRIRPQVNSLVQAGDGLGKLKSVADKAGLQTRAWVVCCHNTPLGMKYPDIACENVFGDKLYHNLCPSNNDVRQFLRALVSDVATHGVDTIELEAVQFQGYTHGFHHEQEGIALNFTERFLMGLCFCPSCASRAKAAGVNLDPIRAFTLRTLQSYFAEPTTQRFNEIDKLPTELFGPMLEWRKSVVSSLIVELMEVAGRVKLRPLVSLEPMARTLAGVDVAAAAKTAGGILALGYVKDGPALREPLKAVLQIVGGADVTLGLQVGLPESGARKEFADKMSVAKELGVNSFNFYNYGLIPLQNLTWIKESVGG